MRGTKAKRLRRLGLKSGPAPRRELTPGQTKHQERRMAEAKEPYQRQRDYREGRAKAVAEQMAAEIIERSKKHGNK